MTTKITRELQCDLTPAEIEAKRQVLAENGLQLVAWEANRKEVLAPIDTEGKHLKTTRKDLAQAIETRRELRPVECIWLEEGTQRKLTRTDTGEVIDQEALSPEEIRQQRQTTLPLEGDAPAPPSPPEAGPITPEAPASAPRALPAHEATDVEPIPPAPDDGVKAAILDRLRSNPGGLLRRDLLRQLLAEVDGADEAQVVRLLGSLLSADLIAYSLEAEVYFAVARPVGAPPKPAPGEAPKKRGHTGQGRGRHGKAAAK